MTLIFDENGHAITAGDIRVFYFDPETKEYTGWSDEFIPQGVSLPGSSTMIDPGEEEAGTAFVFTGSGWNKQTDNRGKTVYSTADGSAHQVDYIGEIRAGYTIFAPGSPYDEWTGSKWVKDAAAERAALIAAAGVERQSRIQQANDHMNNRQWPGKAVIGRLKGDELAQYNLWLDYLDALEALDTSTAPDINWPPVPA
jgi:hypothetical protein